MKRKSNDLTFVKWVGKELKMIFTYDTFMAKGQVTCYSIDNDGITFELMKNCNKQEFDSAKKMSPELLATILLG